MDNVKYLKTCKTLNDYNYCQYLSDMLTQNEFDLLKEWLKYEENRNL